ncbi:hypothetical protein ACFX5F_13110 [Flavobacterium sp. ZS1P70]|uniref:DUF4249 domain-containing protein n=1 Tax=Flavobacterium zhoui TaxID=3230414 RepID=A0ABW6I862_9FLAO
MKSKLYIAGLVFISFLTYSCSDDYSDEIPENSNKNFEIKPKPILQNDLIEKTIDSTSVIINTEVYNADGDPINPIPPRG